MNNIQERQKVFEALVTRGMPEILAASIAAQTLDYSYTDWINRENSLAGVVSSGLLWEGSAESLEFWNLMYECLGGWEADVGRIIGPYDQ